VSPLFQLESAETGQSRGKSAGGMGIDRGLKRNLPGPKKIEDNLGGGRRVRKLPEQPKLKKCTIGK